MGFHLVWCTKYRKKVLKDGIDAECKRMLYNLAEEYKFQILAMEVMPDHIHLLVDCRPQFYISDMIKTMKGNIARQMFLAHPELKKELWGRPGSGRGCSRRGSEPPVPCRTRRGP